MDAAAITAILEDLNEMAATILDKNAEELQKMKAELDEYVEKITSKMAGPSKDVANREFEKCRVCAQEWIKVYCDNTYNAAVKADLLKEEAVEFFFTVDERIIAVQKNFFFLGMIDEILNPSEPFSERKREAKIANARIRILAREQNLKATCKTGLATVTDAIPEDRLWYFGDDRNFLQSSEAGLNDEEAIDYLLNRSK